MSFDSQDYQNTFRSSKLRNDLGFSIGTQLSNRPCSNDNFVLCLFFYCSIFSRFSDFIFLSLNFSEYFFGFFYVQIQNLYMGVQNDMSTAIPLCCEIQRDGQQIIQDFILLSTSAIFMISATLTG